MRPRGGAPEAEPAREVDPAFGLEHRAANRFACATMAVSACSRSPLPCGLSSAAGDSARQLSPAPKDRRRRPRQRLSQIARAAPESPDNVPNRASLLDGASSLVRCAARRPRPARATFSHGKIAAAEIRPAERDLCLRRRVRGCRHRREGLARAGVIALKGSGRCRSRFVTRPSDCSNGSQWPTAVGFVQQPNRLPHPARGHLALRLHLRGAHFKIHIAQLVERAARVGYAAERIAQLTSVCDLQIRDVDVLLRSAALIADILIHVAALLVMVSALDASPIS